MQEISTGKIQLVNQSEGIFSINSAKLQKLSSHKSAVWRVRNTTKDTTPRNLSNLELKPRFSQGENTSINKIQSQNQFFVDQDQMTFDDDVTRQNSDNLSYCGRDQKSRCESQTDVSSQSQFSDAEKNPEKPFNFMDFARLVCNSKVLVTENKLLDKNDLVLAKFRKTKKVDF